MISAVSHLLEKRKNYTTLNFPCKNLQRESATDEKPRSGVISI
jgi:hypothetical protein